MERGGAPRCLCHRLPDREGQDLRVASPPRRRSRPCPGLIDILEAEGAAPASMLLARLRAARLAESIGGDPDPRRGDDRALRPAQGKPCRARLRGSGAGGAPPAGDAGHRALGAVQARRRHRPHPGGRGPGHQPRPMEDHRAAGGGVLRRRGRPIWASLGGPAHGLRRGRCEAVDLLLPGRRSRGLRRHAPAFRPAAGEPWQRAGGGAAHHLLPLDARRC